MQEIIYTSAQRGLKPGSSGFCTVVCTAGIDQRTAQRLESLSGYRHAFDLNDPRNPVNFQHLIIRIGAGETHVLSRVCDAGPDHTGRTNKLAHHIAFTDLPSPSGPAQLLNQKGVFVSEWNGQAVQQAARTLPSVPIEDVSLSAWKEVTGDNGWAGHVAMRLMESRQPISILFSAGMDTLRLLKDVLDVMPAHRRWAVTFSTYYTNPIAGAECQLRFVLDGTKDAVKLKNDARAVIVDLTQPLPAATGGELVEAARKGFIAASDVSAPKTSSRSKRTAESESTETTRSTVSTQLPAGEDDWLVPEARSDASLVDSYSVPNSPETPHRAPNLFGAQREQKERRLAAVGGKSNRGKIAIISLVIVLLLAAVGTGTWLLVNRDSTDSNDQQLVADSEESRREAEEIEADRRQRKDKQREEQKEAALQAKKDKLEAAEAKRRKQDKEDRARAQPVIAEDTANEQPETAPKPSKPVDIFGRELKGMANLEEPAILEMSWNGLTAEVPIAEGIVSRLKLRPLHHVHLYQVQDEKKLAKPDAPVMWSIRPDSESLGAATPIGFATIDDCVLKLKVEPNKGKFKWAALQISTDTQSGFVILQKLRTASAWPLKTVLNSDSGQKPLIVSSDKVDEKMIRVIQFRDGNRIVQQKFAPDLSTKKKRSRKKGSIGKLQPMDTDLYFEYGGGPDGAEFRHVFRIQFVKEKGLEIRHEREYAKPSGLAIVEAISGKRLTAIPNQVGPAMLQREVESQLSKIKESFRKRKWDDDSKNWQKERADDLEEVIRRLKICQDAYKKKNKDKSRGNNSQGNETSAGPLIDMILQRPSNGLPTSLAQLEGLVEHLREQQDTADKGAGELKNTKLYMSVFLPIRTDNSPIILPDGRKYDMKIPVLELTDDQQHKPSSWTDLLTEQKVKGSIGQSRAVQTSGPPPSGPPPSGPPPSRQRSSSLPGSPHKTPPQPVQAEGDRLR